MKQEYLEAGRVRNTHALRGEVKFEPWLEQSLWSKVKTLFIGNEKKPLPLAGRRFQGDLFLLSFEGIDTVEKAASLKARTLFVKRDEVDPEGKLVFNCELAGLPLTEETDGTKYGTILEVENRGGGDLYRVRTAGGKEVYFPVVRDFIVKVDAEKGVFVRAPKGLFEV